MLLLEIKELIVILFYCYFILLKIWLYWLLVGKKINFEKSKDWRIVCLFYFIVILLLFYKKMNYFVF